MMGRVALVPALILLAAGAPAAASSKTPVYVLNGYRFDGVLAKSDTAALRAGLKHHPGDRVTEADLKTDVDMLANELHARHISGRLVTGTAEGNGHIWVFFELVEQGPPGASLWTSHHLVSQLFEGAGGVSTDALTRASGLKPGDALSADKIVAARRAIFLLVSKSYAGKALAVKVRIQTKPGNKAALTWIIGERNPKS